jgi:adenine deaminase
METLRSEPSIVEFARMLPKTETHLHFEGALPIELLREVQPGVDLSSWDADFKFDGFEHFLGDLLQKQAAWFTSVERYHLAARSLFRRHLAENVRYVEVSIASGALEAADLNGREVFAAVGAAVPQGLEVRLFLGIHRDGNTPRMAPVLAECIDWPELAGIDLHGTESLPIEPWTAPLWRAAREQGKMAKAHAGEFGGPDSVWRVLRELEPDRIEHGLRCVEDPALVEELVRRGVALDMCPISNHKLLPGIRLENHPIRELFDAGVTITLSTDDPICFGNTVSDEYVALAERRGFSRRELVELAKNGFRVSLLTDGLKAQYGKELDRIAAGCEATPAS